MKTRFRDSCSHLDAAGLAMKYSSISSPAPTIVSSGGRFSGNAIGLGASGDANLRSVGLVIDSQQTWIARWARYSTLTNTAETIWRWQDAGSDQIDLRLTTLGKFTVTRNGTTLGTSTVGIAIATFHHIVFKVKIHSSIGTVDVVLDGVNILSLTGQNTQATGNATADRFLIQGASNGSQVCDISVADGTGAVAENLTIQTRIYCVVPNGDGATLNFTPSTGTSHYALVDEIPSTADTDYNSSTAAGNIDLLDYTNLSLSGSALGVQVTTIARVDDASSPTIAAVCKSGSAANSIGTAFGVTSSYACYRELYDLDPNTSAAFTVSAIDSAKFGYKQVA